ncbi:BTB/POZ domain-containing protein KCTD16-like [Paramacrobiotus metropolitanus]|uniref:BTB/POZ domain-containing protein KCTD16-like n=1 Tax=Paramacrobiotus metropolitanus TaxID=2943436 RepID=UPI002445816C|nr:BTB/POZ domain-containing protein KCTD16-like [Paramacrobiotus metropolitanus]
MSTVEQTEVTVDSDRGRDSYVSNDEAPAKGLIYGSSNEVIELNVGGVLYSTTTSTLVRDSESLLAKMFQSGSAITLPKDSKGRYFLDRDGVLFRYVLDYLRQGRLILPENFYEKERLKAEADHFKLRKMIKNVDNTPHTGSAGARSNSLMPNKNQSLSSSMQSLPLSPSADLQRPAYITVGYRGTFFSGTGPAEAKDVKFRKLSRILVCGKVAICREVFGESLNESRDPDRGANERYSSRFFLKHNHLEQAFDQLAFANFRLICGCASGTNSSYEQPKPGSDHEENKWAHYNEYTFQRL